MTTQTLQKLNLLDLTDGNSVRSLFQELIQLFDNQKDEITKLRTDYDELKNEKDELGKRISKMERYSSYMCLTFHGIRDGGEYPVHKIVEIIRSVHIPIEPCDIAACHYLPGDGRNKPIIVKFLYNHQRDKVWEQRNSFFDPQTKSIIYVNERLAENDRDVYNYCRKEKHFITATHKNQVRVKVSEHDKTWYPVDSRIQADAIGNKMVSSSELTEWGMEKYPTNEVNMDEKKTPAKRNRHVAFNSPSNEKQPDQSDKLDKLFNLTEKLFTLLVEKQSPPSKKLQTKTNAIKNLMEAVIENPETKILKCQLFLFMMKHQKDQPF